jgi:BirA family biotin operon repressor/biotin-[acetyl-CoA-carboxylase] ligase
MKRLFQHEAVARDWFGLAAFQVGPRLLRDSGRLYLLDEVGSTSEFLRGGGAAAQGRFCRWDGWGWKAQRQQLLLPVTDPTPGTMVVARRQTAGKGRQGRSWEDCGGLHLSVVVPPHRATFAQGFSVWLGLQTVLAMREDFQVDARLKWPNDILVGKRKLGGILLENTFHQDQQMVIAGLGMNLNAEVADFPVNLQVTATSTLIETGRHFRPGQVGGRLMARIEKELDVFQTRGWSPYRPALSYLDCLLGQEIHLQAGGRDVRGRAVGIDDRGRLQVASTRGGLERFSAGDVHLTYLETAVDDPAVAPVENRKTEP